METLKSRAPFPGFWQGPCFGDLHLEVRHEGSFLAEAATCRSSCMQEAFPNFFKLAWVVSPLAEHTL